MKLGILTNPNARGNVRRLPSHPGEIVTSSSADVPRAIDAMLANGVTHFAINGGDGTLGAVISHLHKRGAPLQFVPVCGGTNNVVAKDVGARGALDSVLKSAWAPTVARNTIKLSVNGKQLAIGFNFASGLVVRFADEYYKGPWLGPPQAARVFAQRLASLLVPGQASTAFWKNEQSNVAIDDSQLHLPDGVMTTYAGTIDTQILFFKPFAKQASQLSGFNALVNAMSPTKIGRNIWPIMRGTYNGANHWVQDAQRLSLTGTTKVMMDGELFDIQATDEVTLTPGPRVSFGPFPSR